MPSRYILNLLLFLVFIGGIQHVNASDAFGSGSSGSGFAEEEEEFLRVEQAYQVVPTVGADEISLIWTISPGYYLYQHQFKAEASNPSESETLAPSFSKGKKKYDEYFGKELEVYYNSTEVKTTAASITKPYELKITSQGCADAGLCYPPRRQYFRVNADGSVTELDSSELNNPRTAALQSEPGSSSNTAANTTTSEDSPFLPLVILGAILGGLILNLMPCVFPVLSLKALSFASSHMDTQKQRLHGWAYTAGVVGSFVLAAMAILVAREAGESLGWGFQLQSPVFIAFMAYLFFAMGLSLSGVFHVGTQWMGVGQSLTSGQGLSSSFFTGVLAALVASPCTAPFMASALGFAVTQSMPVALAIFSALGFGMALPFLLLSYSPALARFLPAPGAWMDTLKQFLAFPLYMTSVWLLWVLGRQATNDGAMAVLFGIVLISLGVWMVQQGREKLAGKISKILGVASLIAAAYIAFGVDQFKHKENDMWQVYSPAKLASLREQDTPVFIDLTAAWCITCKFNERVALNTERVAQLAQDSGIVMLQGDWTNEDPDISALLAEFGRSGVPLYLMYPADGLAAPVVLPQILTESIVVKAMQEAL